jgi:hypothetical protein
MNSEFEYDDGCLRIYRKPARGKCTIPSHLMHRTGWRKAGYKVKPDAQPRARAWYCMINKPAQLCDLYSKDDCTPVASTKLPIRSTVISLLRKIKAPLGMIVLDAENVKRAREIIADHPNATNVQELLQQHAILFEVL